MRRPLRAPLAWLGCLALLRPVWAQDASDETCPAGGCAEAALDLPPVIVGCWQLLERTASHEAAVSTLLEYARAGFTAFDTADIYGPSEGLLGEFRTRWARESPGGPAPRFFTKYVTDDPGDREADRVNARSLGSLGVPSADLVQFHWWSLARDGSDATFLRAGRQLSRLKREGKIRHLAGCNMDTTHLKLLVDDGMAVEANQVQYSLLDRRVEVRMLSYCKERGIKLTAFGVVAGGLLSDSFLGLSEQAAKARLDSVSRRMYHGSLQRWTRDWGLFQQLLRTLSEVGRRREPVLPVAAVASAWVLSRMRELGAGGALILGVRDARHLEEHRALLTGSAELSPEDLAQIQAVLDRGSAPTGDVWHQERGWA